MSPAARRRRRRLAAASFGPEWSPVGAFYEYLLDGRTPRERSRALALLREARRDLAAREEAAL